MGPKLLVFHPIIAPYRIDFFNKFSKEFDTKVCLLQRNLRSQKFDYIKIEDKFDFIPTYLDKRSLKIFPIGVISMIKNFNPDIVLVSECGIVPIFVLLFRWLFRKKYRVVSIIDDSFNMVAEGNQFSKKHSIAERILIPKFDNIINVEPRVTEFFQRKYKKGVCFPIIVDENKSRVRYQKILSLSESLVMTYGLEGKKLLLFVGRLVELKNMQMVIPEFRKINDPDVRFILVGSGEYENNLKGLAEGDSRIIFVGRKEGDELYAWYNIANIFVLASYQESFGAVTNEALLGGCWALISEKAGSKCLVQPGINGDVFNPNDKIEFNRKLMESLTNSVPVSMPLKLRDNKMLVGFDEMFFELIKAI